MQGSAAALASGAMARLLSHYLGKTLSLIACDVGMSLGQILSFDFSAMFYN